jgi:hypothetical protein
MDVDEALQRAKLDARLIPEDVADNPWFTLCEADLAQLCRECLPDDPLQFIFSIGTSVQAVILYPSRLVVMYGGMFNAFCRLASRVVSSGAFVKFEGGAEPTWSSKQCSAPAPVIHGLMPFMNWKEESGKWKAKTERHVLFMYLVLTLSRFVTLHEIGHVYHRHGKRFVTGGVDCCELDAANPGLLPIAQSIPNQARELLADNFAFLRLREIITREMQVKASEPACQLLKAKLLGDEYEVNRFLLHVTHLYFHMMDRQDWMYIDYREMTHPPAPFRQQNLYTLVFEYGFEGMSSSQTSKYLTETHQASEALVAVVHQQLPPFMLQGKLEQEGFAQLYELIHQVLPDWYRT